MCFWTVFVFLSLCRLVPVSLSIHLSVSLCHISVSFCACLCSSVSMCVSVSLSLVSLCVCLCLSLHPCHLPSSLASFIWSLQLPYRARPPGGSTDRPPRSVGYAVLGQGPVPDSASPSLCPCPTSLSPASSRLCVSRSDSAPLSLPGASRSSPPPPTSSHSLGCPGELVRPAQRVG